ncbi:LysR family transcriptional regulator [Shewanella sp. NKUCC06_TVS]|uniref:LysR family transcriptional regulator n=1 Tax=Shewanella sp. NKUCC06_TVS TaxID=2842128 RepID=UPI001C5BE8A7|nr:LysR family transcriptional regulator [Shewanella sp. NKUCC06_TVS]MBW3532706.1 LysR family transcriptional regulator [Shewanella sp. NKUCC06_TVS]
MLKRLDLNLLPVLEILLEEQSVTAAAARLHLSQSAVSKQLTRLREVFDDPLFERTAYGLKPTPKALSLAPELRQCLQQLAQFTRPDTFEPALSQRQFRMHLVETTYSLTFPHFMPMLLTQAPGVSLNCQTWRLDTMDRLLRCDIDLAIGCREWDERSPMHVNNIPDDLCHVELVQDYPVCLMRRDHPALTQEWNLDTFLSYRHLQVAFGGLEHWLLDDVLQLEGRKRDIAVNMTDFQSALNLCEQSDLILCAPSRYALAVMKSFELQSLPSPIKLIPGAYLLMWHKHFEHDLSHKWLRELIISQVLRSITLQI